MFDNTQEDFEKKFPANNTGAPYLQRSISAPAIAEHVRFFLKRWCYFSEICWKIILNRSLKLFFQLTTMM